jgi:two-component system, cell cycle response regulator DivK
VTGAPERGTGDAAPTGAPERAAGDAAPTGAPLVLIVEDNPRNLKLVRDVLNHVGYRTVEAGTAEHGLALARSERPGLVLMDIQLPGMDGVEALGRLRADPRTAGIPVLAVTAFAMEADRERLLAAGFDGYLEKPLDVRELPRRVAALLPAPAGTQEHEQ